MTTQRQIDALQAAFTHGSPFRVGPGGDPQGVRGRAGGAFARMVEDLQSSRLLYRRNEAGETNTPTAKGLKLLLEWYKARLRRSPIFAERIREIEAALPAVEAKEAAAEEAKKAAAADRARQFEERIARHREKKLEAFRAHFTAREEDAALDGEERAACWRLARLPDDALIAFVDAIVDKDQAL